MSSSSNNITSSSSEMGISAAVLNCEGNKPDFKELDLGSPVSPLRTNRAANGTATTTSSSSSSGSISGGGKTTLLKNGHSGELSVSSESSPTAAESRRSPAVTHNFKAGHRRSSSTGAPLIYSGGGGGSLSSGSGSGSGSCNNNNNNISVSSSPNLNNLPTGNICPSGKIFKTGIIPQQRSSITNSSRSDVLGLGMSNYGHGSIMKGGGRSSTTTSNSNSNGFTSTSSNSAYEVNNNVSRNIQFGGGGGGGDMSTAKPLKRVMASSDPEEVKRVGNDLYKKGNFLEALRLYDRAIALSSENAAYRSNRAAALTGLGRLVEAVSECEEAVRLDPAYGRAHQRLASLHLRLGQIDPARKHLFVYGQQPDPAELQKLMAVEKHVNRCSDARKIGDWKSTLREGDAAIAAGADSSPQLLACRAEALLKLRQLQDAESCLASVPKLELAPPSCLQVKFSGMLTESYVCFVRAQVEMKLGRFENAVAAAEKAGQIDPRNIEISMMLNNVRLVAKARTRGNDFFKSGMFAEACTAYGEGLKFDPSNSVLYCNRAACWSKLAQWEKSIEDCNQALKFQPNYTKALLRRAASYGKLERWFESVKDYELLKKDLPEDLEVAEALFHAQVAMKKSRGEEISNLKFGGEVEEVSGLDQFKAAISSPGASVVLFKKASNLQCEQIFPFMNTLCSRYPSVNFVKVDIEKNIFVANAENVRIVPTFKIYKSGCRLKEMICPSHQVLEYSVRHYSL